MKITTKYTSENKSNNTLVKYRYGKFVCIVQLLDKLTKTCPPLQDSVSIDMEDHP